MYTSPLFILAIVLQIGAGLCYVRGDTRRGVWLLCVSAVVIRCYFVGLDPFIQDWDERFHALVAKHLADHPLLPTLREELLLPNDISHWESAHIWLHKQPLFLWQMALCIKLFGANIWAVRLPSLLMTACMVPMIYSIGRQVANTDTGFIAAFAFSCYEPLLEMNSGYQGMEHNDLAFLCYVSLSLWAWICYERTDLRRYLILIGLAAGCAVLCKWLTGMLIFGGYGCYHMLVQRDLMTRRVLRDGLLALAVCIMTMMPWQLYIMTHYPAEAAYEYHYNTLHMTRALEGHAHERWYYLHRLSEDYKGLQLLIYAGVAMVLISVRRYKYVLPMVLMIVAIYGLFTIAETKMPSYVMLVVPMMLLLLGLCIASIWRYLPSDRYLNMGGKLCILLIVGYCCLDTGSIQRLHYSTGDWMADYHQRHLDNLKVYEKIATHAPANAIVVNLPKVDDINCMFYVPNTCYGPISDSAYQVLRVLNRPIIWIGDTLPLAMRGDGNVRLLRDY